MLITRMFRLPDDMGRNHCAPKLKGNTPDTVSLEAPLESPGIEAEGATPLDSDQITYTREMLYQLGVILPDDIES